MSYRESDGSIWEGAKPNEGYFACDTCGTTHFRLKDTILDAGQNQQARIYMRERASCHLHNAPEKKGYGKLKYELNELEKRPRFSRT